MMSSSNVRYDKGLREKAKAEGKRLITIDYDGRAVKKGRVTLQMAESPKAVAAVERCLGELCADFLKIKAQAHQHAEEGESDEQ